MPEIKIHSKKLDRFTALVAFVCDYRYESLRGFETTGKMQASFMAKQFLKIDDGVLSAYYRCGVEQMQSWWVDMKIQMELDDAFLIQFHQVQRLWINMTDPELKINF